MKTKDNDEDNQGKVYNQDPEEATEEELDRVAGGQVNPQATGQPPASGIRNNLKLTPDKVEARGENIR